MKEAIEIRGNQSRNEKEERDRQGGRDKGVERAEGKQNVVVVSRLSPITQATGTGSGYFGIIS